MEAKSRMGEELAISGLDNLYACEAVDHARTMATREIPNAISDGLYEASLSLCQARMAPAQLAVLLSLNWLQLTNYGHLCLL